MLNWRETPFIRVLAVFIAGILLSFKFNFNHTILMALPWVFVLLMFITKKWQRKFQYRWLFGFLGSCFLFLLGYQITYYHDERNAEDYIGHKIPEQPAFILGEVSDAPIKKGDWVRVVLETKSIGTSKDSISICSGNILLYIARDSASEAIAYGDIIYFNGKPENIKSTENPHSFNYKRYLHFQNIHHQAFVRHGDWEILDSGHGNIFFSKAIVMQGLFLNTLRKHLTTEKELAVGSALILGYRDEIPEEVQTAYSQTGAMHVLAVSGLHVGIIFIILNFFLKKIKINTLSWRIIKVLIVLVVIWAFALVTGASPSVMRAAVMFSFLNVGLAFQRYSSIYNTLAASAFFILLFNPYLIASVGFQLSYLAVFGIVYFQPKIVSLWSVKNKIGNYLWQLTCVSLAAQIMTLPLTFYYFNQLPIYFWLTGLILVPLAGVEMGIGIVLLLFEIVFPVIAVWIGKALWLLLWIGNKCVFIIQHLPVAVIDGIWIGGTAVLLLYLFITSIMAAISTKKYKWLITGLAILLIVSLNYAFSEIKNQSSQQIVIYKIYKHSAIDFFDGKKVFSITDENIDKKALGFATEGHRYAMGMELLRHINIEDTTAYIFDHLFYKNNFLQFYNTKITIVDNAIYLPKNINMEVDYILLRNSPKIVMDELVHIFDFKKLIFDNSNKKWQVEKWKEQCEKLQLEYYDIAVEGAFILDLKKE